MKRYTLLFLLAFTPLLQGEEPVAALKKGNERFANNTPLHEKISPEERKKLSLGQNPIATIVACADSRVAPELLFDQGPGELFVVRLAGNTVDAFALASIEFGLSYLKTPLLVVMGHQDCGAVIAAFDLEEGAFSPKLTALLEKIRPATERALKENPGKSRDELVEIATWNNVAQTRDEILRQIPAAARMEKEGKLQVEQGVFDIKSGMVLWKK